MAMQEFVVPRSMPKILLIKWGWFPFLAVSVDVQSGTSGMYLWQEVCHQGFLCCNQLIYSFLSNPICLMVTT
jgi:hypothetical protein